MIKQSLAQSVLSASMETGADFAELFVEDRDSLAIRMQSGNVENINSSRIHGAGVRIFLGNRSVYVFCNDTSERSLMNAAKQAAAALFGTPNVMDIAFRAASYPVNSPIAVYPFTVGYEPKLALLRKADAAAKNYSEKVAQVTLHMLEVDQKVLVANSEGLWGESRRVRSRFFCYVAASSGAELQTGYESKGYTMGFEMYDKLVDVEAIAKEASRQAVDALTAPECPAGFFPVVIESGSGVIFHEACGHALEATSVAPGNSVFAGKLGQQIAAPCVSAIDDGTIRNAWGTLDMDDEGNPTQKNLLIENGILKGYLIDRLGGRRMGMKPTGSGRRESYEYAPTSRMNNTYICEGTDDNEEMIRTMGEGLFAKTLGGGQVNPLTGEFNFGVDEGYWVKDGKIVCPVRGGVLIGKGSEVLMNIDRVGTKMGIGIGMCGSLSGSVPAGMGQPRIRVTGLTVGGKGGKI